MRIVNKSGYLPVWCRWPSRQDCSRWLRGLPALVVVPAAARATLISQVSQSSDAGTHGVHRLPVLRRQKALASSGAIGAWVDSMTVPCAVVLSRSCSFIRGCLRTSHPWWRRSPQGSVHGTTYFRPTRCDAIWSAELPRSTPPGNGPAHSAERSGCWFPSW